MKKIIQFVDIVNNLKKIIINFKSSILQIKNILIKEKESLNTKIQKLKNEIKELENGRKIEISDIADIYVKEQMEINPLLFMIEILNNNIQSEKENDSKYIGPFDHAAFTFYNFDLNTGLIRHWVMNLINSKSEKEAYFNLRKLLEISNSETNEYLAKLATNDFQYKLITNLLKYPV